MTTTSEPPRPVAPALVALLVRAAEATEEWAALVTPEARLDRDLKLDECELALLGQLLLENFGPSADLAALRARLDLDELEALTVADLQCELLSDAAGVVVR